MSEDKLVTCAIDTSPEEKWGTPEDGLADLKNNMIILMSNYVSFMWQVGQYAAWVQEMANYGDGAIEKLCEELRHKKTWVYSCINMHKMYPWEVIEQKFIAAGVPATSIARLASIEDDSTRNYVEDKIIAGEIYCDDINKVKKEFEESLNDTEHSHEELGSGSEPSMEEIKATNNAGEDSPSSQAATVIRKYCGDRQKEAEILMLNLDDKVYAMLDKLSEISDDSLYDLSLDRIVNMGVKLKKLGIQIDNVVDTVSKHRPSEFED
jgi:hypothetical protein